MLVCQKNTKKQTKGKIPIGIGFGVSTPEDVRKYIMAGADAVIVGSAYLKMVCFFRLLVNDVILDSSSFGFV